MVEKIYQVLDYWCWIMCKVTDIVYKPSFSLEPGGTFIYIMPYKLTAFWQPEMQEIGNSEWKPSWGKIIWAFMDFSLFILTQCW